MGDLKYLDDSEPDFIGEKLSPYLTSVVTSKYHTFIVSGLPACTECGAVLAKNIMADTWTCPMCKTYWSRTELIEALINQRLTTQRLRDTMDEHDG